MPNDNNDEVTLEELGNLLTVARRNARKRFSGKVVSREVVGKAIGVNPQSIYEWENGKSHPGVLNVLKYSQFLGLTMDELLGVKNSNTPRMSSGTGA